MGVDTHSRAAQRKAYFQLVAARFEQSAISVTFNMPFGRRSELILALRSNW